MRGCEDQQTQSSRGRWLRTRREKTPRFSPIKRQCLRETPDSRSVVPEGQGRAQRRPFLGVGRVLTGPFGDTWAPPGL